MGVTPVDDITLVDRYKCEPTADGDARIQLVKTTANAVSEADVGHIYEFLRNSSDELEVLGNFSVTPGDFRYTASSPCKIERMIVYILANANIRADGYGPYTAPLANGLRLDVLDDADDVVQEIICHDRPVTSHALWAAYCYDSEDHTYGTGPNAVAVRWTFGKSGAPIYLDTGHSLRLLAQDDLSDVNFKGHTFHIQGVGN